MDNEKDKLPIESYVTIQSFMIDELNLTLVEATIFSIIHEMSSNGKKWYNGGNKYLQLWTGKNKNTVINAINKLCELKLIERKYEYRHEDDKTKTYVKHRSLYNENTKEKTFVRKTKKIPSFKRNPKDITNYQINRICRELENLEISELACLFVNKYYDFISYYMGEEQDYLSDKAITNLIQSLIEFGQDLDEDSIEQLIDMYIDDWDRFSQIGITPSISHFSSQGIIKIYIQRLFGGFYE